MWRKLSKQLNYQKHGGLYSTDDTYLNGNSHIVLTLIVFFLLWHNYILKLNVKQVSMYLELDILLVALAHLNHVAIRMDSLGSMYREKLVSPNFTLKLNF